ncbi:CHAD domain-containing protein [Streptomyces sp. 8N616]|uniref:CHAD domain-containing protein n=1 Tax=Streptomyces sp. 8N616 TaxID=3457414 RepID=UPI003FD4625E
MSAQRINRGTRAQASVPTTPGEAEGLPGDDDAGRPDRGSPRNPADDEPAAQRAASGAHAASCGRGPADEAVEPASADRGSPGKPADSPSAARRGASGARARVSLSGAAGQGESASGAESAPPRSGATSAAGTLTVGAARAGALLERQLTLARTRAHSAALQALGSSRFHAVADAVAVLASEAPLDAAAADGPADKVLGPLVDVVHRRLVEAVEALPLHRAGHPYNAEALVHGLAATGAADAPPASEQQDAPWHQVRLLVRLRRYAQEVLDSAGGAAEAGADDESAVLSVRLQSAAQALDRHRDAAEAAAAAAAAARTPRIAPATAYALGVLHADQRYDVEAARYAFGRLWERLAVNA